MGFGNPMGGNYAIHQVIFSRQPLRSLSAVPNWAAIDGSVRTLPATGSNADRHISHPCIE